MSGGASGSQAPQAINRILNSMQSKPTADSHMASYKQGIQRQKSLKSGWLRKQGGVVKSWHRRWFAIRGDQMQYFTTEDESKSLGSIFLPGNKVVEHPMNPGEPEKFLFEIVAGNEKSRMTLTHDTYPLCASSEEERRGWIQAIKKVMYSHKGGAIFGQSLADTTDYERRTSNRKVPEIVQMCVEYLLQHGLEIEGIFRLPGRSVLIRELRDSFDEGERPTLSPDTSDIHSVGSLLKLYLRELPEPLIPLRFYEPVMKIVTRDMQLNPDSSLERLSKLMCNIPKDNYNLLQYLCKFLKEVSSHSDVNKMPEMNLATVFLHSVIRPEDDDPALLMGTANGRTQVTFLCISQCEKVFRMEYNAHGAPVQVDNLLDLDLFGTSKAFNPDTTHEAPPPVSQDLFDLGIGQEPVTQLPSPMTPGKDLLGTNQDAEDDPVYDIPRPKSNISSAPSERSSSSSQGAPPVQLSQGMALTPSSLGMPPVPPPRPARQQPPAPPPRVRTTDWHVPVPSNDPYYDTPQPVYEAPTPTYDIPPAAQSALNQADDLMESPPESPYEDIAHFSSSSDLGSSLQSPEELAKAVGEDPSKEEPRQPTRKAPPPPLVQLRKKSMDSVAAPPAPPRKASYDSQSAPLSPPSNQSAPIAPPTNLNAALPPPSSQSSTLPNIMSPPLTPKPVLPDTIPTHIPVSHSKSSDSIDTIDSGMSYGYDEDDEVIDNLIGTNTEELSQQELQGHVEALCSELKNQRSKVKEVNHKLKDSKEKYKNRLHDMAKKLDAERNATADAVERIMTLQKSLQAYYLKFGILDDMK